LAKLGQRGKKRVREGCAGQWQVEQLEEVQEPHPDEPMEVTVLLPLEKPKREIHFRTLLLRHLSQRGNGALDVGSNASKAWWHFSHSNS
jgi:hypothetical protein